MAKDRGKLRLFQPQAFPSWRRTGAFGGRTQSGAALAACGLAPEADTSGPDGKAVEGDGMLVVGGADGR